LAVTGEDLRRAREAAEDLLEEMGLAAYLYEVEPGEGVWWVRVECAVAEGWQVAELPADHGQLLAAPGDARIREGLLADWGGELGECRRLPEE
jgi:hypothetical protein